jgi:hypothetical protein
VSDEAAANSTVIEAEPAQPVGATTRPAERGGGRKSAYRKRFALVYVLLAVAAGAAAGSLIVLLGKPDAAPNARWSAWEPSGSPEAKALQIADRIPKGYRLDNGSQLAVALVGPPAVSAGGEIGEVPIRAIAVRPDTSRGQAEEDDIAIIDAENNMMFVLCGLGEACSIAEGEASEARHALLRREALELSLYTFKYVPDVSSVTVFLPPRPDGQSATSVFVRRGDVGDELGRPLNRTLGTTVPGIGEISRTELQNVNRITLPRLFNYEYTQAQDGSAILILSPVALGA